MSVNFNVINNKLSSLAADFQTPDLLGASDDMKSKLQASSESIFKNTEGLQESLTAQFSAPDLLAKLPTGAFSPAELESKLKGLAGEVKGGVQMVGPIAADLADKAKILEPQLAALDQSIADKLPAMKEAISDTDLANVDKMFTAATSGVTAIDIKGMFPDIQATVENVAEMNFDIVTTANLEGITTALQTAIPNLPLEDLTDIMGDLVPTDILGVGSFDPLSMMRDFQGGAALEALGAATAAATAGFQNALGGLGGGGLLMGVLESTSSVISNTVFGAIPSFDKSKLGSLIDAFSAGDAITCRALAIKNLEISDKLKGQLEASGISAKFGSIDDLQSIISKAEETEDSFTGDLGKELSSLQSVVDNIEATFPDTLPTAGSFLKKDNPLPEPTVDTVTFKGGKATTESKGGIKATATTETTAAGNITTTKTATGVKVEKAPVILKVSTTSDLKGSGAVVPNTVTTETPTGEVVTTQGAGTSSSTDPLARATFNDDGSASLPSDATAEETAAAQAELEKRRAAQDQFLTTSTDDFNEQESVKLYDHKEVIAHFKSAERAFTTLVFDWTGTYADQNMTAHDVNQHYKSNGKTNGIPFHILIQKNGHMELARFLDDLPLIGGGYNDNAVFVGVVAGYDTPAPKEAFQRGTLSAASVTKQQFRRMRIIAKAFTDVLPIGQVYGINELSADRTTVSRSGPGVSVEAIRAHIDKDVIGMGEVISNGKFFTTEELKAKIESKLEGED
jgi:hypothetical protein